ncbi:MAG: hypothetical protein KF822_10300 [Steroidobacteraceae bacterium]|nr:hypothetical protein [Steroidobacteraceae bacterium]
MSEIKIPAGPGNGRSERGGTEPAPRPPRRGAPSRHGAISRELTKYASYKSWADKMRGTFAAEADDHPGVNGNASVRGTDRR